MNNMCRSSTNGRWCGNFIVNGKFLIILLALLCTCTGSVTFADESSTVSDILFASESLFKSMKERNYIRIWSLLSEESKKVIQENVHRASLKAGSEISPEVISDHFRSGELTAREYWDAYLEHFDPDLVLEESTWKMGPIGQEDAEVIITFRKSDQPARLKMILEAGRWKVGLVETFWPKKAYFEGNL